MWDTCTGTDARLARYYSYWEARIYRALTNMILNNLQRFIAILGGDKSLCKIFAVVAMPEVVLSPSPIEVSQLRLALHESLFNGLLSRFLSRTCTEVWR